MENMYENQKVVDLLSKIKNLDGSYPSDMLAVRRQTYLKQMANVGMGIGIGAGLNETLKGRGNGATTTVASEVLEIALITAIVLEAGTAAYLYRDKLANAVRSYFSAPTVQEVSASAGDDSSISLEISEVVGTPSVTASQTPSGTPSAPPSTAVSGGNNQNTTTQNNNGSSEIYSDTSVNANATPNPNGNSGNHYGQTPIPLRTKENNGGGGNVNNDGGGAGNDNGGGGNGNREDNGNNRGGNNNSP
jgi:hypothetical protein